MRFIRALVLRLVIGLMIGVSVLLAVTLQILPHAGTAETPPLLVLLLPMLGGMLGALLIVDGGLGLLWAKRWSALADGREEIPYDNGEKVRRTLRSLTGPLMWPSLSDRLTNEFCSTLATQLLRK